MPCFCGHATDYAQCCAPFHRELQCPASPEQLMRARFSAYVLKNADYIARTYHSSQQSVQAYHEISQFADQARFLSLQIIAAAGADGLATAPVAGWTAAPVAEQIGYVHFVVRFLLAGSVETLEEVSRFVQQSGVWSYLDGQLQPHPVLKPGRNDPCPCGSGRKFKLCREHWLNSQPCQAA